MSKRQRKFEHVPRSYYPTPIKAVEPLIPHLPTHGFTYIEPCVGDGRLVTHLRELAPHGRCVAQWDIEPKEKGTPARDALDVPDEDYREAAWVITNPPWERSVLHPMIDKFSRNCQTWLLFDTNWFFTKQANLLKPFLHKFVTVGRVSWLDNGKGGFDDAAWYLFDLRQRNRGYIAAY